LRLRSEHWLNNAVTPCDNPVHTLCCNCPDQGTDKFEGTRTSNVKNSGREKLVTNSGRETLITNEDSVESTDLCHSMVDGVMILQLDIVTRELDDSIIGCQGTAFFSLHVHFL